MPIWEHLLGWALMSGVLFVLVDYPFEIREKRRLRRERDTAQAKAEKALDQAQAFIAQAQQMVHDKVDYDAEQAMRFHARMTRRH